MAPVSKALKSKPVATHICEFCDKGFFAPSHLERHRRIHTNERPFSCNLCDYSATRESHLQAHISSHLKEKPFKCGRPGCKFAATETTFVKIHQRTVHLGERRFECPIPNCGRKFGQKGVLNRHLKTHEENPVKPFKCLKCPYKSKRNCDLKSHMTHVHSGERNFKCSWSKEGCKYAGKTKKGLKIHLKSHNEKTLACPHGDCEYKTNSKNLLKSHITVHNLDKKYKCRLCDYSSHQSANLTVHMRIHTKETPYKCTVQGCLYQGKTAHHLQNHMRGIHEKMKPFKCPFFGCPYAATVKGQLKSHRQRKHPQEPISSDDQTRSF